MICFVLALAFLTLESSAERFILPHDRDSVLVFDLNRLKGNQRKFLSNYVNRPLFTEAEAVRPASILFNWIDIEAELDRYVQTPYGFGFPQVLQDFDFQTIDAEASSIALIGDSESREFELVENKFDLFVRAIQAPVYIRNVGERPRRIAYDIEESWFFSDKGGVQSLSEILVTDRPLVFRNFSRARATVFPHSKFASTDFPGKHAAESALGWVDKGLSNLIGLHSLKMQVDELLKLPSFPDLVLIWLGHNNLDWVLESKYAKNPFQDYRQAIESSALKFENGAQREISRLVEAATISARNGKKVSIVVFGLFDISVFSEIRKSCANGGVPLLRMSEDMFPSFREEYREGLIESGLTFNSIFQEIVEDHSDEFGTPAEKQSNVQLYYSSGLTEAGFEDPSYFSPKDCWHMSDKGKSATARVVLKSIERSLRFLGW